MVGACHLWGLTTPSQEDLQGLLTSLIFCPRPPPGSNTNTPLSSDNLLGKGRTGLGERGDCVLSPPLLPTRVFLNRLVPSCCYLVPQSCPGPRKHVLSPQ